MVQGFRDLGVYGLWFMVYGLGLLVQGSGFGVQDLGFRLQASGFRVQGLGSGVWVESLGLSGPRAESSFPLPPLAPPAQWFSI